MDAVIPTNHDQSGENHFFLTRQTANLMEDFVREIGQGSSFYLLYGEDSVGKSWLLRELISKRFAADKVSRIDFKQASHDESNGQDAGVGTDATRVSKMLETARDSELIVIDHFEAASNKARHALFQGWLTEGIDKKLNLIVAANTSSFNDVRQLAEQSRVEVKSFQLLPFSRENVEAYLSFRLFPESSLLSLSMPGDISRQVRACKGNIGKIAGMIPSLEGRIGQKAESSGNQSKTVLTAVVISLLVVIAVSAWYLRPQPPATERQIQQSKGNSAAISAENNPVATQPEKNETAVITEKVVDEVETTQSAATENSLPVLEESGVTKSEQADLPTNETIMPGSNDQSDAEALTIDETDANSDIDSKQNEAEVIAITESKSIDKEDRSSLPDAEITQILSDSRDQYSDRFLQDLGNTLEWIRNIDKNRTTIQIMSLGFGEFTDDTYYKYLDRLIKNDIDVSRVRIYPTRINNSIVYGVIYGDYENRKEANQQIRQLPDGLKANQPIPRTMGGIWNEITRK